MPAPGCVLALRGEDVVYESSSGPADPASGQPCTRATRFQIASISKQFTAAAVLLLVDAGAASLQQRLEQWIPRTPPAWRDITVHELLTHTSGLGHWDDYPSVDLCRRAEPDELVETFLARRPDFPSGSRFAYSSPGYVLLARLVEYTSGRPYHRFLAESVFEPLGMAHSFAGSPGAEVDLAVGCEGATPVPSFELDTVGIGAGDVWSTTFDLAIWDRAVHEDGFLTPRSRSAMLSPQVGVGPEAPDTSYGYGWVVGPLLDHRACYHEGHNDGFTALNAWLPDVDVRFVALSNQDATDKAVFHEILASVLV